MKSSHAKKASITLPAALEGDLKKLAKRENRTLSGLIQEAARHYLNLRRYEELQRELAVVARRRGIYNEEHVQRLLEAYRAARQ